MKENLNEIIKKIKKFSLIAGNTPTEGIGRNIAVLVPDLHPGNEYMFEITTEAHGRKSQTTKTKVRTMPLITSEITVINQQEVTTALTLRYTPTPFPSSYFDTYRLDIFRKKTLKAFST